MKATLRLPGGLLAIVLCTLVPAAAVWAEPTGLVIDASAVQFVYTKSAGGPGSIGRIDITQNSLSSLIVQQLAVGQDDLIGGVDDTLVDIARIIGGGFTANFTADVFQLGTNSYSVVGLYTVEDAGGGVVVEGDFNSDFVSINNGSLWLGGMLSNADGVLRPGGSSSWVFEGDAPVTKDYINGLYGGADGVDGFVTLSSGREFSTTAGLLEFQFIENLTDLDTFFNQAQQAGSLADLKVQVTIVPAPGAVGLAVIGLACVAVIRRRLAQGD